ncbi:MULTISPECIES: efflux RND transporter permease subunit [Rhizobium/Agrobacterium group]|jgi:multidrug efflux pump|uniref:Efflux pump membrane transporter n=2 Tax=Rhizobium/Agrobacterium group TaxID=227290 RepID=A0A546XBR4_RHIRH|nr:MULTISPECIES: efflux RND transporter permease subunit [Rhizobium/Agrobacterium group]MCZ7469398.1 efflux RND transporter permease subunit [Rhizobium rhizogenes]MCZ7483560.1 efflux RND transporter permease subunit [Rhizobium rhizogenes]MCZ7487068.1 efflux RND transporter permease subunit [Rhizobium rhizogenes]MDA5635717.1 efflux RND transporter permease subunit [Agrobacterium sp. ST15.16.024]MDF1891482.1 efflux RND transporter permease subunit [Rhizobium rhizogenes]
MARFFIDRPIFAWVVAIFIMLAGLLAIPMLPIAQYPNVAPPQISVGTTYPGASPEDIYQSVTRPIEEELNGVPGLIYFESTSESSGRISINVTFEPGTNIGEAQVEVQNRIARVEPRLPRAVTQQGLRVEQAGTSFLMMVALTSVDGNTDAIGLGDYLSRNVVGELRRVPGVGSAQLFATQRSMRIWMDPDKMLGLSLTSSDVINAIQAQNSQVAAGRIGASPNPVGQQISATVNVQGQLTSPEEFGSIVLRANPDGSSVRLRDVARVEVGGESYTFSSRLNGKPSAAIGVQLSPTGNALQTSDGVRATMEELSRYFPAGIEYEIPYDTSPFVKISIQKVINTLVEAIILVFVVMFVFLQNIRYTIIPTLVVPVALLGTCAIMYVSGFSINVLTMFAMVLAIGILVDDAIVVVENVERIMAEEHLSPKEATRKAMGQISGAIIGITLVLTAVFVPMAFFPGAVGIIYQQFSLTMVVSILFSGFLALSLTPALCASFLKPIKAGHHEKKGFFGWFNRGFDKASHKYSSSVGSIIKRSGRFMVIYAALLVGLGWAYMQLPSSFLPNEDQGYLIVDIQAPAEASSERTLQSIQEIEKIFLAEPAVDRVIAVSGFSFSGSGQNAGLAFATLKDWSERGPEDSASAIAQRINGKLWGLPGSMSFTLSPPPIQGLGNSSGFTFRLQDRGGAGQTALSAAGAQLMAAAQKSPILAGLRVEGMPDSPQVNLIIDREKANTFGVTFSDINATISANMGSSYVNDFPNAGRMQRVTVQAEQGQRMKTEDLLNLNVRNANGGMVPVSSFATVEWVRGPSQVVGYNGYPAIRIGGQSAPGYSSGDAIAEMERLAGELPSGFGFEWTGQSLQEIQSGSQAPALIGLSVLFVFLLLAALYESWSIPLSVMLVVPLGVIGSVAAVMLRGMPNDVYFLVGLVAIIGLSAKNAILIIEFAKDLRAEGKSTYDATVEAAHLRFRPILMTSLAFSLGVLPMAIASGASAASQNAIGTGVLGGMISATILAIFFVPVFFVFVMKFFGDRKKDDKIAADAVSPAE